MSEDHRNDNTGGLVARIVGCILGHPRLVVLASALILVVGLVSALELEWREDVVSLLPRNDPVVSTFSYLTDHFEVMDHVYIDVGTSDDGGDGSPEALADVADELHQRLVSSGHFKRIVYRWDYLQLRSAMEQLERGRASLFTWRDAETLADTLTYDAVCGRLSDWKRQLIESPAPLIAQTLYSDPFGVNRLFAQKLGAMRSPDTEVVVRDGRLTSKDGRHLLIVALVGFPSTDSRRAEELIAFLDRCVHEIEKREPTGRIQITYFGGHRASLDNARQIKADIRFTVTLSVVAIVVLSLLVYRRWWLMPLTLAPVLFGATTALALLRWFDPVASAIAIGCGSMLIGIAVDYAIHILYIADQSIDGAAKHEKMVRLIQRLSTPIMLSACTTFGAFCILHWSIMPGYRHLGHFAAPGILSAALFSIIVLPVLVTALLAKPGRRPLWRLNELYPSVMAITARRRGACLVATALASVIALVGVGKLGFEGDIRRLNSLTPEARQALDGIVSRFGDMMTSTALVVRGETLEDALRKNERLTALLRSPAGSDALIVSGVADILPSRKTQEENRRRWENFWDRTRIAELRKHLERACRELRMNPAVFVTFFESLPGPMSEIRYEDCRQGLIGDIVASHLATPKGEVAVLTRVRLTDAAEFETLAEKVAGRVPGTLAFSGTSLVEHVVELVYGEMIRLGAATFCFIAVVLTLFFRRPKVVVVILAPLLVSMLWTLGCMGWLGIRLNLMNSVVAVFIFGLIVDYAIFLAVSLRQASQTDDQHVPQTCAAVTISALTTMCGMGALIFAGHPALRSIGVTALLAIGSGLLAVFTFIPLFKHWIVDRQDEP